jgi:4-hydroxybenzoate polyprenyltransferase
MANDRVRSASPLPDTQKGGLIDRFVPIFLLPFCRLARWDRPIGWQLLLLPCLQSSALAANGTMNMWHAFLFLVGAIAMRGAGCTYNDIVDRDLDAKVERTRHRPLPAGQVSVKAALVFTAFQALIGLVVLLQFSTFTILLGFASLGLVACYPFMKRIMGMPQLILGLTFGWGALMGWAAARGSLELAPVLLYVSTCFWIIGYDTIYALQDIEDDEKTGIKSSARLFAIFVKPAVAVCYGLSVLCAALAFHLATIGLMVWIGLAFFAIHLGWQIQALKLNNGPLALKLFRSNRDAGLILLLGLIVSLQ